ncbi:MAG: type II toxin-antitoxin system RelE/ParE family toxin [Sphaerochaeta sp.]
MKYKVEFTKSALEELKKLDKHTALFLTAWIRKNLEGCSNPFEHGKRLIANHGGQWRYRVGTYRIIAEISEDKVVVLIVHVGHRKDIYNDSL